LEKLNNRERENLDTIAELKSKLIASDKLIRNQEIIITNFNKRLNNLQNKNKVCVNSIFFLYKLFIYKINFNTLYYYIG